MLLEVNPLNPDSRQINKIVACLKDDGIIVIPTDTVYAMGCSMHSSKAFEKICKLKNIRPEKANFSFIMNSLSDISAYTKPFDRSVFKLLNKSLPGPFTFILEASNNIPSFFRNKKKTVGIRIPNHKVPIEIANQLSNPLLVTSLHLTPESNSYLDYPLNPLEIFEQYSSLVDIIIDGGWGHTIPSTVVDCT
ncbi:MAG TPA: L-threonylcarbamoyladenylate synthase, partial [Bacteroidia bacterium]|nr:L-threonylcarbamoyladenylate synthase [Bacteroidia bacterium]